MILKSFLSFSVTQTFSGPPLTSKAPLKSKTNFSKSLSFSLCSSDAPGALKLPDREGEARGGGDLGSSACFPFNDGEVIGVMEFKEVD
jgi:hypothetical protein